MNTYQDKLKSFHDKDCVGDWGNCVECPDSHHKDGACTHPLHPSMQSIETEFGCNFKINPVISKVFHDIRNTYQAIIMLANAHKDGEESIISPDSILEQLERDLRLMEEAEQTCKKCEGWG